MKLCDRFLFIHAGVQLGQVTVQDLPSLANPPGSPVEAMVARVIRSVAAQIAASDARIMAAINRCKSLFSLHIILWLSRVLYRGPINGEWRSIYPMIEYEEHIHLMAQFLVLLSLCGGGREVSDVLWRNPRLRRSCCVDTAMTLQESK